MTSPRTVAQTGNVEYGGTRFPGGISTSTLWSDGVVIAHAWSFDPSNPCHDVMFTFRGSITRGRPGTAPRDMWSLRREGDGGLIETFRTRKEALFGARHVVAMDSFRAVNAMEALAARTLLPIHDCPTCACTA